MEVTGTTAPFNHVDLVARVQGFLDKVGYKDGAAVKKGDLLFQIDKQDYEIALQIAQATQQQQEALLMQADADLKRKQDLVKTSAVSVAQVDESRAKRDSTLAALAQAKGQVAQAQRNLAYTTIVAPFDGIVSARLVDPGAMVGAGGPTKLATIVQVMPIYVKFNVDEQQVLSIREKMRIAGVTLKDLGPIPIGVGLQTEQGYPHTGTLDYVAPEIDSSTGTLAARAVLDNKDVVLQPGLFVRVRIPKQQGGRVAARARHRPRQQPAGPLPAHRQRQERRRAAPGAGGRTGRRRTAHHRQRPVAERARRRRRPHARAARQHRRSGHDLRFGGCRRDRTGGQ